MSYVKDCCLPEIDSMLNKVIKLRKGSWYRVKASIRGEQHRVNFRAKLIDKSGRYLLFRTEVGYKTTVLKVDVITGEAKIKEDK